MIHEAVLSQIPVDSMSPEVITCERGRRGRGRGRGRERARERGCVCVVCERETARAQHTLVAKAMALGGVEL
jgi:hypothetical protein